MKVRSKSFGLVTALAVAGVSCFALLRDMETECYAKQSQLESRQRSLAKLNRTVEAVETIDTQVARLEKETQAFESRLPSEKGSEKVLNEIRRLAEANSLQTEMVTASKPHRLNGFFEQSVEATLNGDFNGFYEFMLQVEQLPQPIRVTRMNLSKAKDHDGSAQAQLTLSILMDANSGAAASTNNP